MKQIKILDLSGEHSRIKNELDDVINKVVLNSDFVNGATVVEFEKELSDFLNCDAVGVGNGTDAIRLALLALGLKKGDEVIVPAFTYYATVEAVVSVGLVPVLIDVKENSFSVDFRKIKLSVTAKTKAIIVVHMYGTPVEMERIMEFAKNESLFIIEDCAQAIGATVNVNGKLAMVSTIGDVGTISFYPGKNLGGMGDGGAVVSRHKNLLNKVKMFRNHGQSSKDIHEFIGMNSRLDSIQAAVLGVKLKYLTEKNNKRVLNAKFYDAALSHQSGIICPPIEINGTQVFHQYTIIVKDAKRDSLREYLRGRGIPTKIVYPIPIHLQKGMIGKIKVPGSLSNTEFLSSSVVSLPVHPELNEEQLQHIVNQVNHFFRKI